MRGYLCSILIVTVTAPCLWSAEGGQKHPVYVGARVCANCHEGKGMGHQFSRWLASRHARAYAILGTPLGYEKAAKAGVSGNPQKAERCLRCHAPGALRSDDSIVEGFDYRDGVQCEDCHGAGASIHLKR